MKFDNPVFLPGPTNMPEILRKAIDIPTVNHRAAEFGDILHPALDGVKKVLKSTTAEVFIFPASGTGGWEIALVNTLSAGDKVLATENGFFSMKWVDMCQRHGLDVDVIKRPWGSDISAEEIGKKLAADTAMEIKVVIATYNETATAVRSDIAAIRKVMDDLAHPALLYVDGVSAIGSMDFRMDEWGVDVAVTGSQKGFMLPPGLAIVGISPKATEMMDSATLPRTYFDLRDMRQGYAENAYPYTPSAGMINGLKYACEMLLNEGLENVFARHKRIADGVRAAVGAWGLAQCAHDSATASDSVTAVMTPDGFDAGQLVGHAVKKYQTHFGGALGQTKGTLFRIGHLGAMSDVVALSGVAVAEMAMKDLGVSIELGSGVAAAQEVYRNS